LGKPEDPRVAREALRAAYDDAFSRLAQILFEEDPIGINFEDNTDEYEPEAGTILPRLRHCTTVADIQGLLYPEFLRWFDGQTAGPPERYRRAAERISAEMAGWRIP
jgi:hypothetical protein